MTFVTNSHVQLSYDARGEVCSMGFRSAFLALLLACGPALAQMPADIAEKLRAIGPVIDPRATADLYIQLHSPSAYEGVKIERNVRHNDEDNRHSLDLFLPQGESKRLPVLVFVPGSAASQRKEHGRFYDNFGLAVARAGMIGLVITDSSPPQRESYRSLYLWSILVWLRSNIDAIGGDMDGIFFVGHSEGARDIADWINHLMPLRGACYSPRGFRNCFEVKGMIVISGNYDVVDGLARERFGLLVAHAELDPPEYAAAARRLYSARCAARPCPTLVQMMGHNHMSAVYSIGTADDTLWKTIVEFVNANNR